jgi:SPP1 family predicted phage head-tail adaptor
MEAGKLDKLVTIQSPTRSTDTRTGQRTPTAWVDVDPPVWAAVWPRSTREGEVGGRQEGTITHEVRMRYTSALTTESRLKLGSRILSIVGIDNVDEANVELRITAKEQT